MPLPRQTLSRVRRHKQLLGALKVQYSCQMQMNNGLKELCGFEEILYTCLKSLKKRAFLLYRRFI